MSPDDEAGFQTLSYAVLAEPYPQVSSADNALLQHAFLLADPALGPLPYRLGNYELLSCIGRNQTGTYSFHVIAMAAMCDGSVHLFSPEMEVEVITALLSRNGDEIISTDDWQ